MDIINPKLEEYNDKVYKRIKILLETATRQADFSNSLRRMKRMQELELLQMCEAMGKSKADYKRHLESGLRENNQYFDLMRSVELEGLGSNGRLFIYDIALYRKPYVEEGSIRFGDFPVIPALLRSDPIAISELDSSYSYLSHLRPNFSPRYAFRDRCTEGVVIDTPFIHNVTDYTEDQESGHIYYPFYLRIPDEDIAEISAAKDGYEYILDDLL